MYVFGVGKSKQLCFGRKHDNSDLVLMKISRGSCFFLRLLLASYFLQFLDFSSFFLFSDFIGAVRFGPMYTADHIHISRLQVMVSHM